MCGICGIVKNDKGRIVQRQDLERMCRVLRYRGPDEEGIYLKDNVGLGHRRLKIIDLSPRASQPMTNEDKSLWIVCNGEIYNFLELREGLEKKGHHFISHSDTEVILHLYEEKGIECVDALRGMFAFGLWDARCQRLLLARDRVGKKPLVYIYKDGDITFASEAKALLELPNFPREVNLKALHHYLTYQYVPAPMSMFEGINKLPPAHILVWEKGNIRISRYWDLKYQPKLRLESTRDYKERFLDIFKEAVSLRLASDVPLGVFLSGGIDSSLVVAMMSRLMSEPVKTFSVGFEDEDYSELRFARIIARKFNTDHHEVVVNAKAVEVLPRLVWHYDEPFADSSAVPTYYISQFSRQYVTVVLSGDGGDESFAGYERYLADRLANIYLGLPPRLRRGIIKPLINSVPVFGERNILNKIKRFIRTIEDNSYEGYGRWVSIFDNRRKEDIYSEELKQSMSKIDSLKIIEGLSNQKTHLEGIDRLLYIDIMSYLPGDLLVKMDIASMANSLEVRSPFLDQHLMEFAASLPAQLKLNMLTTKYFLRKNFSDIIPGKILNRPKMGFGVPIGRWLRSDLKNLIHETLLDEHSLRRGYFNRDSVVRLLKEHTEGRIDHSARLWLLLMFELWHRLFIQRQSI